MKKQKKEQNIQINQIYFPNSQTKKTVIKFYKKQVGKLQNIRNKLNKIEKMKEVILKFSVSTIPNIQISFKLITNKIKSRNRNEFNKKIKPNN